MPGWRRPRRRATPVAEAYARAAAPGGATPWRLADFCVVDLELSGLDAKHDEIISFGAVPIDSGRAVIGTSVYGVCRPTRPIDERSVLVHGIRTMDLADAPRLETAIEPLIEVMTGRVLVAHVAWVEHSFLSAAFRALGVRLREPIIDTYEMGRLLALQRHQTPPDMELAELARSLSLPVHCPHHALGDALTTAQVFIALATHLDQTTPETVRSLARSENRTRRYTSWKGSVASNVRLSNSSSTNS